MEGGWHGSETDCPVGWASSAHCTLLVEKSSQLYQQEIRILCTLMILPMAKDYLQCFLRVSHCCKVGQFKMTLYGTSLIQSIWDKGKLRKMQQ